MLDPDPYQMDTGTDPKHFITRYFTQMYEMSEIDPSTTERLLATCTLFTQGSYIMFIRRWKQPIKKKAVIVAKSKRQDQV
jgi:hypothetical protein